MPGSRASATWIAGTAGLIAVGIGIWWLLGDASGSRGTRAPETGTTATTAPSAQPGTPAAATAEAAGGLRIASGGRLVLDADALPDAGPLSLVLELDDAARGNGERAARVVSPDGRRIDLTTSPLPGSGSGLGLSIDPAFLTPGLYMIEVDTAEADHFHLRRYVLEIR